MAQTNLTPTALSDVLGPGQPPDRTVAVRAGDPVTLAAFRDDVAVNADRIRAGGYRRGAPVCTDTYWFAVGLFALLHAGASVVLPPSARSEALAALRSEYDVLVGNADAEASDALVLETAARRGAPLEPFDPAAAQIDFFTSGSSGRPKRVTRTVRMIDGEIAGLAAIGLDLDPAGLVCSTVSHQHAYGLVFKLLWPICSGRAFSGVNHEFWETTLEELTAGGVLVTSPAHLTRLAGIDPLPPDKRPSLILTAGARLPIAAARETAAILGVEPTEMFGSTETGAFATRRVRAGDEPLRPAPGIEIDFTHDGRLMVRAPHIAGDEWYVTEDLAAPAPEGGFRFVGRADRVVKIEGKRVSLPEIEQQLAASPLVEAAAAVVVGGEKERLGAVLVLTRDGEAKRAELGGYRFGRLLRRQLARSQEPAGLPRLWRYVRGLPRGDLGKMPQREIAALFEAELES